MGVKSREQVSPVIYRGLCLECVCSCMCVYTYREMCKYRCQISGPGVSSYIPGAMLGMCMYLCMHIVVCVCMYVFICMCVCICVCMYTWMCDSMGV